MNMITGISGFAALMIVAVILLSALGALKGFSRGISRQVIRTATIIVSIIIAIVIAKSTVNSVLAGFAGLSSSEVVEQIEASGLVELTPEVRASILSVDPGALSFIIAIPLSLVVAPLIFTVSFIIISGLMLIVHVIVSRILRFSKKKNNIVTRLLGMGLGAVQGFAVAVIIFLPLVGTLSNVSGAVNDMVAQAPDDETVIELNEVYESGIKELVEPPVVKMMGALGGKALYGAVATVKIEGEKFNIPKSISEPTVKLVMQISKLEGADMMNLTPENETAVTAIIDILSEHSYTRHLLSDIMNFISSAYENRAIEVELESPANEIVDAVMETLGLVTDDSIETDLDVLTEAYFILSREGVLLSLKENIDSTLDILTKEMINEDGTKTTVAKKVISTLNNNANTVPLVTALTKISVSALANSLGSGSDEIVQIYDNVKSGISDTLAIKKTDYATQEEYIEAVSGSIDSALKENNITLEKEIVDEMAQYVSDNYGDRVDEVSDQEINDIILSYYDAYMATQNQNQGE